LETLRFGDTANKLLVIAWLQALGVNYTQLSIASFVHVEHAQCVEIHSLLRARSHCDPKKLQECKQASSCKIDKNNVIAPVSTPQPVSVTHRTADKIYKAARLVALSVFNV